MLSYIRKILPIEHDVYEFDDELYIEKNHRLLKINTLDEVGGAKRILTDFNNQAFARLIYIESQPKYAELLAKKKINDSGEFDDSIDLHVHKKQKVGDLTKLYCTPIPAHILEHYRNIVLSDNDGVILSSIHDALWSKLKKGHFNKPVILIFAHHKSYEILIASSKQVYFAGRFNAFEYDVESIDSIWDVINTEIKKIQDELSQSIKDAYLYHTGIESAILTILKEKMSSLSITLKIPESSVAEKKHNLDVLMNPLGLSGLPGGLMEKSCYLFQKHFAIANMAAIVISLGIFSVSAYAKWQTQNLIEKIDNKTIAIKQFKMPIINIPENLQKNVSFYEELKKNTLNRQISTIFSDLSSAATAYMTVNKLNFIESQSINSIEVDGSIVSSFDNAYQSYKKMIASLKNAGYSIAKEDFSTDINQSNFSFVLEYTSL